MWSVAVASLLSMAALLLITVDGHKLLSIYGATLTVIALLIFVVYQFVALRSVKQVLLSLPCYLLTAALAFGISLCIGNLADGMLNTTPRADEIESVTFRGHDVYQSQPDYTSLLVNQIRFTDDGVKKAAASALSDAVDELREPDLYGYQTYNPYQTIEPITLRLKDGRTVDRTIEFRDVNALNKLRSNNAEYQAAMLEILIKGGGVAVDRKAVAQHKRDDCADYHQPGRAKQRNHREKQRQIDDGGFPFGNQQAGTVQNAEETAFPLGSVGVVGVVGVVFHGIFLLPFCLVCVMQFAPLRWARSRHH